MNSPQNSFIDPLADGYSPSFATEVQRLRDQIKVRIAELGVETRHTDEGHFYWIPECQEIFPSVTGEHRNIKDPSIRNFEKNEALRYVKAHFKEFTDANIDEHLKSAAKAPILVRDNAGTIGTYIHHSRQVYFQKWIDSGSVSKPAGSVEEIARARTDIPPEFYSSVISGSAAMDKFIAETGYIPLGVEFYVYDKDDKVAGQLDDVGLMPFENKETQKRKWELVLGDVKSSNQFKDTYTLQVMRYNKMFVSLFRMRPKRIVIIKTDKFDRTYQLEWFNADQIMHGVKANRYLHKFNYHWEKIREARKIKPKVL